MGYGVVLYDVSARARAVDQRLTLTDLRYGLYSGEGRGTIELELGPAGLTARARITGERVRIDEFMAAYGIRGGTMTGLLRYDLDMRYGGGRLGADGGLGVPEGGTVTIELLDRLLSWAEADPTGLVKRALGNLRAFDYKAADMKVRTDAGRHPGDPEPQGTGDPRHLPAPCEGDQRARHADRIPGEAVSRPMRLAGADREGAWTMNWSRGSRPMALATLAIALAACVPVTVNVTFPQEKLDNAARQIEEMPSPGRVRSARDAGPGPVGGRSVDVASTPRLNERSPEVVKATDSRRARRPELREWKSRGCMGETNQGLLVARPGDGCGPGGRGSDPTPRMRTGR